MDYWADLRACSHAHCHRHDCKGPNCANVDIRISEYGSLFAFSAAELRVDGRLHCGYVSVVLSVYLAEWLNKLATKHWEKFSRQMYFDPSGFFV